MVPGHSHGTSGHRTPTVTNRIANQRRSDTRINAKATAASRRRCRFVHLVVDLAFVTSVLRSVEARTGPIAMRQTLLRAILLLTSWAIGLVIAAWTVPGVSLSVSAFIVAVVIFAVTQATVALPILKLPYQYASLLLGGTGLALTIVALILASILTRELAIDGTASWLATTVAVWLMTTIGAITLPQLLIGDPADST